ncbi:MAG: transcription termination factor Rho [Pseudonocardia sp.]|nr:transcription termination factor Rho [Pseudonocardia sp.]
MSETDLVSTESAPAAPRKRGGLTGMVLAELRALAGELNIPDIAGMRKGELIAAIKERQGAAPAAKAPKSAASAASQQLSLTEAAPARRRRAASRPAGAPEQRPAAEQPSVNGSVEAEQAEAPADGGRRQRQRRQRTESGTDGGEATAAPESAPAPHVQGDRLPEQGERQQGGRREDNRGDRDSNRGDGGRNRGNQGGGNQNDNRGPRDNRPGDDDDDDGEGRGRRGRRFRDRRRGRDRDRGGGQGNIDTEVRDGDVLLPVAGIVDILDNYAFVRTTGYLAGPTDVYVSLSMVRKYGLRRGDAITGTVREPREGEQSRQKFNPLVRVDSINGQDPEQAKSRPEFMSLTPLYPNDRLRLETEPHRLTTRVIDLVMPVGKGQRALIVSPPKAGKTTIMQNIANAITTNNPECHLMVVLVDERPEEVTDMQRSVKGEVIASTFDRPPTDHTTVAELSIERAKRLVEMGHDVVVLLDNITRLGRAYNLAAPASGRILSGGVDSTALYPPKRFLGAARNIEDGGSLTIFATALVETGSTMDTVIFEEFKGTGNAELRLDRKIADKRVFPAIDVSDSGTRKDELLLAPDEHAIMVKLRRLLSSLDDQQAIDLLLTQLKKTRTNIEFLMQVQKNAPGTEFD